MAVAVGREAARLDLVERKHEALDGVLGGRDLRRCHLREVLLLQHLAVGHGETRIELELRRLALGLAHPRQQRLLDTLRAGRWLLVLARRRLRQHGGKQLVDGAAAAEEDAERLLEDERVLVALHEYRVQRPVEIVARADARRRHRGKRVHHRAGTDRNAGRPQRAGEVDDVLGQPAGLAIATFCVPVAGETGGRRAAGGWRSMSHWRWRPITPPRAARRAPRRSAAWPCRLRWGRCRPCT